LTLGCALAVSAACGDDDGAGGAGGSDGPTTSSPSSSGAQSGGGGTGPGGPFEACTACNATACGDLLADCAADAACASWLACAEACEVGGGLAACLDACDAAAMGQAPIHLVYACGCQACPTECGAVEACTRKCEDGGPPPIDTGMAPMTLAETGLYDADGEIAPYVLAFQPRYALWSDGAAKNRWAYIPACDPIDTSDPDHWGFPVGTRLWKEFTRDGVLIETRLIHRYGPDSNNWLFATYQWGVGMSTTLVTNGVTDANGTGHDIPTIADCGNCHGKLPERALGFSAIQLTHTSSAAPLRIDDLSAWGYLTVPAPPGGYPIPDGGDATVGEALGHLHANCGNCHNDAMPVPPMLLRVLTTDATPQQTGTYTTAVNVLTTNFMAGQLYRIEGADPDNSAIIIRMAQSTMPPIASEIVDADGITTLGAWIQTLPPPN
jgi:hypothetical protein